MPEPLSTWHELMGQALALARQSLDSADVPVGALVVTDSGEILGQGWNTRERDHDPSGHAEILALRQAAQAGDSWRLDGATLVVTFEPCVMCAGAIAQSGIHRLVYGAPDQKAGAAGGGPYDLVRDRALPHRLTEVVGGVRAEEAAELLRQFFQDKREV